MADSPTSPWHAVMEAIVRTSPATVGAGASLSAGIEPSVGLFVGLGALTLAANILGPISRAIGDGVAFRVKRRLEGPHGPPVDAE